MTITWREAAIKALEGAGPLSVPEVTERIQSLGLRELTGNTPEATVGAALYIASRDGDPRLSQSKKGYFEHTGSTVAPRTTQSLGRLETISLRDIWPDEARNFTPWLFENPEILAEPLGIDLEFEQREHSVGPFSLDLFGRDLTHECPLIVENQLEDTDHRHLGQLLTYAAGTDALTVIWIAPRFRDEHRQALEYLNHMAGDSARFFGVEFQLAIIGDSDPAPLLTLAAKPSDWRAQLKAQKSPGELSAAEVARLSFWTRYLDRLHAEHPNTTNVKSPQKTAWMNLNFLGNKVIVIGWFLTSGEVRCELYIDSPSAARNEAIVAELLKRREEIEAAIGSQLTWEPLEGKRASRIRLTRSERIADEADIDRAIDWLMEHQIRFKQVFRPLVTNLDPSLGEELEALDEDL
jgi:hypothetical protein